MKVILLQDIARMGRKHEVKIVPDGHAQNYLIPRRLALVATAHNLKQYEEQKARSVVADTTRAEAFRQFLSMMATTPLSISAPANTQGNLFKGLRATDIAIALSARADMPILASALDLAQPIKTIGEHSVGVRMGDQQGTVVISVTSQ